MYRSIESGGEGVDGAALKQQYLDYLEALPVNAAPEIFGLHQNADITCAQNETYGMLATILSLQPRASSGGGKSRDELLDELAADILSKTPTRSTSSRSPTSTRHIYRVDEHGVAASASGTIRCSTRCSAH